MLESLRFLSEASLRDFSERLSSDKKERSEASLQRNKLISDTKLSFALLASQNPENSKRKCFESSTSQFLLIRLAHVTCAKYLRS